VGPISPEEAEADDQFLQALIEDLEQDVQEAGVVAASRVDVSVPERPRTSGTKYNKFKDYPHACLALSDAATWGSAPSQISDTDVPSTSDELTALGDSDLDVEFDFDDEYVCHSLPSGRVEDFSDSTEHPNESEEKPPLEVELPPSGKPVTLGPSEDPGEADQEEPEPRARSRSRGRRRTRVRLDPSTPEPPVRAAAATEEGHLDYHSREAMQQLEKEESGKRIVKPTEVRNSAGPLLERWKTAAEAELTNNFLKMGAFHEATKEELSMHGRPLPMLCVWSQADDHYKCRACVCGNFAEADPTQQSWTAQAEPSSLLASLKLGRNRGWLASKHDVKGAFMHAKIPEGRIVIVSPPDLWVKWGLVPPGTYWTLEKAVYGLRESPCLWAGERDSKLEKLTWTVGKRNFCLKRCAADSQVWILKEDHPDRNALLGLLIVYVDDFLLQVSAGAMRDAFLASLSSVWTLAKEEDLTVAHPITFLGIDIVLRPNGDVFLHRALRRFNTEQTQHD